MTFDEYIHRAMRSDGLAHEPRLERLKYVQGAIGGEAGEVVDYLKKVCWHNKPLDRNKVVVELGDLLWGVAHLMYTLNISFMEVTSTNLAKLGARYPNGYTDIDANKPRTE